MFLFTTGRKGAGQQSREIENGFPCMRGQCSSRLCQSPRRLLSLTCEPGYGLLIVCCPLPVPDFKVYQRMIDWSCQTHSVTRESVKLVTPLRVIRPGPKSLGAMACHGTTGENVSSVVVFVWAVVNSMDGLHSRNVLSHWLEVQDQRVDGIGSF